MLTQMKVPITLLLFLMINCFASAQSKEVQLRKDLSIQTGLNFLSLKDLTFSPIVFKGAIPEVRLGFNSNKTHKTFWSISAAASTGEIDYQNKYFSSNIVSADFSLNYLSNISTHGNSTFYFGGRFNSVLNILEYDGFLSGSWYTAHTLEPIFICNFTLNEQHVLTGKFHTPIAGLVSRPTYGGVDEYVVSNVDNITKIIFGRSKFYSIDKLINPTLELKYNYLLPKLGFSISGEYNYLQVNSIRKYYKNEWTLLLEFKIRIGKINEG